MAEAVGLGSDMSSVPASHDRPSTPMMTPPPPHAHTTTPRHRHRHHDRPSLSRRLSTFTPTLADRSYHVFVFNNVSEAVHPG